MNNLYTATAKKLSKMISDFWKSKQISDVSPSKGDSVIKRDLITRKRLRNANDEYVHKQLHRSEKIFIRILSL